RLLARPRLALLFDGGQQAGQFFARRLLRLLERHGLRLERLHHLLLCRARVVLLGGPPLGKPAGQGAFAPRQLRTLLLDRAPLDEEHLSPAGQLLAAQDRGLVVQVVLLERGLLLVLNPRQRGWGVPPHPPALLPQPLVGRLQVLCPPDLGWAS